jgi:hypothetical protein
MFELSVVDYFGFKHEYTFHEEHSARRMACEWKHKSGTKIKLTKNGEVIFERN